MTPSTPRRVTTKMTNNSTFKETTRWPVWERDGAGHYLETPNQKRQQIGAGSGTAEGVKSLTGDRCLRLRSDRFSFNDHVKGSTPVNAAASSSISTSSPSSIWKTCMAGCAVERFTGMNWLSCTNPGTLTWGRLRHQSNLDEAIPRVNAERWVSASDRRRDRVNLVRHLHGERGDGQDASSAGRSDSSSCWPATPTKLHHDWFDHVFARTCPSSTRSCCRIRWAASPTGDCAACLAAAGVAGLVVPLRGRRRAISSPPAACSASPDSSTRPRLTSRPRHVVEN